MALKASSSHCFGSATCRTRVSSRNRSVRRAVCLAAVQPQQSALITGSSTGIGQGVSLDLAQKGWRVFAGVRTQQDATAVRRLHPGINPVLIDVTSEGSIAEAKQQVQDQLGDAGLSLLVNNAGVGLVAPVEFVPLQEWRRVLDVNLQGPLAVTQAFLPLLRQGEPQQRRIINVSSVAGHLALPFWSAYNCSKAGLDRLSECLRYELADQGIAVVNVKPGPVRTPIWDKSRKKSQSVLDGMPAEMQPLYGATIDKMNSMVSTTEETAIPVSEVVQVIVEAATAAQPKAVYLVGKDATLLPDQAWINFTLKALGQ